jgi:hypothetical protein
MNTTRLAIAFLSLGSGIALPMLAHAHGTEARYVEVVDWQKEHVARVFAANTAHFLGMQDRNRPATPGAAPVSYRTAIPIKAKEVEGRSCLLSQLLAFDIDNRFAYDVDESMSLTLTFAAEYSSPFYIAWDKSGGTGAGISVEVTPQAAPGFQTVTIPIDRARLAGQGTQGADIAIGTRNGIMLCDFQITRSNSTQAPAAYGTVKLSFKDAKTGGSVPARVGLYDATGRAPLASDQSLMMQRFADDLRMLAVNERTSWPSANRQAFYVDGSYEAKVPVGAYELVATRGPEFKAWRGKLEVKKDKTTKTTVALERYADLPAKGWYSGDGHIHVTRDEAADPVIWGFVAAEDVHVGNLLEMGNIASLHFKQPKDWGKAGRFERDGHFLVSGQEDPRTGHFGHTIHQNLQQPIRPPTDEYFLYDKVFKESQRQGGVSGFAHMGWGQREGQEPQMNRGLTLLAPTGLVNFIEVLQAGRFLSDGWYRLLNLGYRINPAAGSDWPYSDFPGVVRNYVSLRGVKLNGSLNLDAWFESYRAGHTYVTNGPFLEFSVNGKGMGEELRVKKGTPLDFAIETRLNPDVDKLDRLELVALGDVIETQRSQGSDRISLSKRLVADHSMWVAARSFGSRQDQDNMTIAHSAPIYIVVDEEPTWSRTQLPAIVGDLRYQLGRMLGEEIPPIVNAGPEVWETRTLLAEQWLLQRPLLKPRIEMADAAYRELVTQFEKFNGVGSGKAPPRPATREMADEEHDH